MNLSFFLRIIPGKLLLRYPVFGRSALVGIVLIVILLLYLSPISNDSDQAIPVDLPPEPVAQIKILRLKKAEIQKTLTAYGVVLPLPDKLQTISVSYPSQIEKIQVNPGQLVQSGTILLSLKPGPTALLQWHKAQTELQAALRNQQLLQQRIRLKLATRQDLIGAQLRVDQATVMIKNMTDQGINKIRQITARHSGIIYQVNVQQGQQLPAGAPLLQIVAQNQQADMLPREMYYELGGLYQQQQIAFHGLMIVFIAAVGLIFILLLYLYEHFHVALAMLLTTLSAVAAVFVGLWITGAELNITALMGMTMVIGIVTEVSIFYYSEYESLPATLSGRQRMITAGINRMRPIVMTTLAAVFALMPLAMGLGAGSEMLQPLAIAIVSGIIVQIPLVLIILPVFLTVLSWTKVI